MAILSATPDADPLTVTRSWTSLQATAVSAGFVGLQDLTLQASNMLVHVNIGLTLAPQAQQTIKVTAANLDNQDGTVAGKIQFGSGWWFLDQMEGMTRQIEALSQLGLLSRFVGMLTDSRSFLSYSRHEYFRRILCGILGRDMAKGLVPNDTKMVGKMIQDISFNNAKNYFPFVVPD